VCRAWLRPLAALFLLLGLHWIGRGKSCFSRCEEDSQIAWPYYVARVPERSASSSFGLAAVIEVR